VAATAISLSSFMRDQSVGDPRTWGQKPKRKTTPELVVGQKNNKINK